MEGSCVRAACSTSGNCDGEDNADSRRVALGSSSTRVRRAGNLPELIVVTVATRLRTTWSQRY
jgi:hypothetical protein